MRYWLARLAAVVAGLVVSVVLIAAVQAISVRLFPPPPGMDANDPAAIARFMQQLPIGARRTVWPPSSGVCSPLPAS